MNGQQPGKPPEWVRAVNAILAKLETGELKPGRRLPPIRGLAAELGVCRATVGSAYRYLKDEGIIGPRPGGGQGAYIICKEPHYTYPANPGRRRLGAARKAPAEDAADGRFGLPGDPRAWVRMANMLMDGIRSGQYTGQLPSRGDLAASAGTSTGPVTKACLALQRRGIIASVPGVGYAVLRAPSAADDTGAVLDWLKSRHGDGWEDIKVTWSARCRTGDGQTVTAGTAGELDALLQAGAPTVPPDP